jgi:hypothetical protein
VPGGRLHGQVRPINFSAKVYAEFIVAAGREVDFEISIDETSTPTLPEHHFFVASELIARQVGMKTIAPRFCGEFQKGVDYIGDLKQFEQELRVHAAIADHFGYKLSVHSGSDKFSVFKMVGKATKGRFHLKTAGTSWLEAIKLVAMGAELAEWFWNHIDSIGEEKTFAVLASRLTK